jgi:hypothetical protein
MHAGEGKVPEDEAELCSKLLLDLLYDRVRRAAMGTFIVSVFDQRNGRRGGALGVVAVTDGKGQIRHKRVLITFRE